MATGTISKMEGTSGTPHLLTDVRFSVSRKGYDPDEVDNFLERVSTAVAQLQDKLRQATAQAEDAESRAVDGARSLAVAQARLEALEGELASLQGASSEPVVRRPEDDAENASKVLVLAQRTADAAIEDANATASATLADARAKATALVGDAERESARLLAVARIEADALVTRRRDSLASEIHDLETARDSISADVSALEWHVGEQRSALLGSVARLQAVLDDPAAFRLDPAPHVSETTLVDVSPPVDDAEVVIDGDDASAQATLPTAQDDDADGADDESRAVGADGAQDGPTAVDVDEGVEDAATEASSESPVAAEPVAPVLFDGDEHGEATQAHDTLIGPDESSLGPPDDDADAAMKAFFEAEFDDDPGRGGR